MGEAAAILGWVVVGSVLALAGGVLFLVKKSWSRALSAYSVPFAAGVMITVSVLGLIPEGMEVLGEGALMVTLAAFFGAYLFENYFFGIHHHERGESEFLRDSSIRMVIAGDTIHNFVDGAAIAAAYLFNPGLGVITALSTFLHEVPHEIGDFGILLKAGWKRKKIFGVNLVSAMAAVAGAVAVMVLPLNKAVIGVMVAGAAGLFLYLGASDFLPHLSEMKVARNKVVGSLLVGAIVMAGIIKLVPHQ